MEINYYIRSIEGEVVQPEMETDLTPADFAAVVDYTAYKAGLSEHIKELPVTAKATPELVKLNGLGFIKECRVRYQAWHVKKQKWNDVTKEYYDFLTLHCRILLDVPDVAEQKEEGGFDLDNTQLVIGKLEVNCFDEDSEMSIRVGKSGYQSLAIDEAKLLANYLLYHIKCQTESN